MPKRRHEYWLFVFLLFVACVDDAEYHHSNFDGIRSGDRSRTCIDQDKDGFGQNCPLGNDCDDADPDVTRECVRCARIVQGCPCDPGQSAIACYLEPIQTETGRVVCTEGTRFCRDGGWSECESLHTYFAIDNASSSALIDPDPDAGVPHCNLCNPTCYRVTDPLDSVDGGIGSDTCDNVCWADGGGIRLTSENEGDICHDGETAPPEPTSCVAADSETGTLGSDPLDDDCDGIPNAYDPDPDQRLLDTTHQVIFARLGPGDTLTTTLKAQLRAPATDLYFLLDQNHTMSDERTALLDMFNSDRTCEAHSDCPGLCLHGRCFGSDSACNGNGECSGICADHSCRFLSGANPCRDIDGDGSPNDELKNQGVLGSIRCMIDQPRFGAGYYNELPLAPYSDSHDERIYQHLGDIGEYDDAILLDRLSRVENYFDTGRDYPQAQTQALWSIATAGSIYVGMYRPSVPPPAGCSDAGFGYPCFGQNALPVVLMLTDSPFHNGSHDIYDYQISFPIGGDLVDIPATNDTVFDAFNAGLLSGDYLGVAGSTRTMAGYLTAGHLGCSRDDRVEDAYFRFAIETEQQFTISTENSDFDTVISLFRALRSNNTNETTSDAFDIDQELGADIRGRRIKLIGDTSDMRSDYPGEVVGADSDNQSNDAVFRFSISEPTTVRIDTEGSEIGTRFALYEGTTPLTDPPIGYGGTLSTTSPGDDCSYYEYDQHGYWFCTDSQPFAEALSRCSDRGMSLARIDDADENEFIKSNIIIDSFIGAHDRDVAGKWQWADNGEQFWNSSGLGNGEPVNDLYSNWSPFDPYASGGEDCAEMYRSGIWYDISCNKSRDYICESQQSGQRIERTLSPGDYYIVVKGRETEDRGRYALTIQDVSAIEAFCNNDSGSLQTSEMTATLSAGEYLLVLRGNDIRDDGAYRLHIWSNSFRPRTWDQAIGALQNRRIRVMTLLACDQETHPRGGSDICDQAFNDAAQLAIATEAIGEGGQPLVYRVDDSSRIPIGVVAEVRELLKNLTYDVGLRIAPAPDANPFISTITTVENADPHDCSGVAQQEFLSCSQTSQPEFALRFSNPEAPDSVPGEGRGYSFKIQIVGDGKYVIDEVPAYLVAESEPVPSESLLRGDPYSEGSYLQDIDSSGCKGTTRPDWHTLQWSADVPSGSRIVFKACTSETKEELEACTYQRVAAVTTIDSAIEVTGGGCEDDDDCSPLKDCEQGTCTALAECLGSRCVYAGQKADIGIALGAENNLRRFLRLKVDLSPDSDTHLTTPTLFDYQIDYVCTAAE